MHNALNGAAALEIVRMVLRDQAGIRVLLKALGSVGPAFGRGESIDIDGSPLEEGPASGPLGLPPLVAFLRRECGRDDDRHQRPLCRRQGHLRGCGTWTSRA